MTQLSHSCMTAGKTEALTIQTFVGKMMSLVLNMLCRFVIAFFPRSKCLLISWLQSLSAVIFGAQENKIYHCYHFFPIYLPWSVGTRCHDLSFFTLSVYFFFNLNLFILIQEAWGWCTGMILGFWMLNFKPAFPFSSPSSRGSLITLLFLPLGWYHLHIWGCWYFSWQSWCQLVIHPAWHFA